MAEILPLPDCRSRELRGTVFYRGVSWRPIFCANCGADGGLVPEDNCNFAFYLCNPCAETHGQIEGTYAEPDIIFWKKVQEAQLEKYGRVLTEPEVVEALKDDSSVLSKLAKDRK